MKLTLLLLLLVGISNLAANPGVFSSMYDGDRPDDYIKIMSMNTKWLFDQEDDPEVELDEKFASVNYPEKLQHVADVINRNHPDVLGMQEVENRKVLEDLCLKLKKSYKILHFESLDYITGQDVAFLYNPEKLEAVGEAVSNLDYKRDYQFENKRMKFSVSAQGLSKGILQQELKIKANDEKIVFLVTHLKAQPGGFESDLKRIAQAHTVRMKVEEILQSNKKLVLMGDFNDVNPSPVIEQITGESKYLYDYDGSDTWLLFDLLVDYPRKDNFTYVSKRFLSAGGRRRYMGTQYCRLDYIFTTGVLKGGMRNGYIDSSIDMTDPLNSDHYPVCIEYHYRTASESVSEVSTPVATE